MKIEKPEVIWADMWFKDITEGGRIWGGKRGEGKKMEDGVALTLKRSEAELAPSSSVSSSYVSLHSDW